MDVFYGSVHIGDRLQFRVFLSHSNFQPIENPYMLYEPHKFWDYVPLVRVDPQIIDHPVVLLSHRWDMNYRHFLIETAGHLATAKQVLERSPDAKVVILEDYFKIPFVRFAFLSMLQESQILVLPMDKVMHFSHAVFYTHPPDTKDLDTVADQISKAALRVSNVQSIPRIYLDRKDLDHKITTQQYWHGRRILNKDLLYPILQEANVVCIEPGVTVSYPDQVKLISQADHVVAEISAACDNILFCKPGAKFTILCTEKTLAWAREHRVNAENRNIQLEILVCGDIDTTGPTPTDHWNYPWWITEPQKIRKSLL